MNKRGYVWVAVLCLTARMTADSPPGWKIEKVALSQNSDTEGSDLTVTLHDTARDRTVGLTASVRLTKVGDSFTTSDKLVVLGEAGEASAVVAFDIPRRQMIDWFFCYDPRRISENWISYVEFYFPHVPGGEPTDVVLVYDLSKTPRENRLENSLTTRIPPGELENPTHVGTPVYPEWNARQKSYRNVVGDYREARHVLGTPFVLLPSKLLVFVAAEGVDFGSYRNYLVAADLSRGLVQATSRRVDIPKHEFKTLGENANSVRVERLEVVSGNEVRVYVPRADYGVESIVVNAGK